MYFDIKPKSDRKNLFGGEYALNNLSEYLLDDSTRLIIIKGLRRTGKTSLLNVALNELKADSVKIDVRESPYFERKEFFPFLIEQIKQKVEPSFWEKVISKISGGGISYKELTLDFFFSKEENVHLFFQNLNQQLKKKNQTLVLAFDEIQLLKAIKFDYFVASAFDNYGQLKFLLTGSEIGLLDKFMGRRDYDSPLYGRACLEVELNRLKEEETKRFLEEGFKQLGKQISFEEIKEVVSQLDGIIGWTTYYGWLRQKGQSHEKSLERVKEEGKVLVKRELDVFLSPRQAKGKYLKLLKFLARGENEWDLIKYAFLKEKIKVADSQLGLYLKELSDYSFIEKQAERYLISDPIMLKAVRN
ncbi:ATP-binding protein [Candidatus Woesearchaeota archaeon]|nr:ATP-binding protein [Candidatus Woesearchaeota archaeon]